MFGITLFLFFFSFCEKVLVYGEAGALPAPELEKVLGAVKDLDMEDVHKKVAEQQQKQASDAH